MSQPYPPPPSYPQPGQPQYPPNAYQQPPVAPNPYQQQPPVAPPAMGQAGDVPPDIMQYAIAANLGAPLQTYKPRFSPAAAIGIAVGVTVLDIIVLVAILIATDRLPTYLIALPIVMIIFAVYAVINGDTKVYVFAGGLVHAKGQQRNVVRWDQVEAVWQKITRTRYYYFFSTTNYKYTIRRNDGATFKFGSPLHEIANLGDRIQHEVAQLHTPRAIAAYNSGAPVVFGPLTLGMPGVSNGREPLPWNQVKGIKVNRGVVSVLKEGQLLRWGSANVEDIPNYKVFLNVANHGLRSVGKAVE